MQRSDGKGYDKAAYLARSMPKIQTLPTFHDLMAPGTATSSSYASSSTSRRPSTVARSDGRSPQLMVYRVTPERWQVVAAANFARLD